LNKINWMIAIDKNNLGSDNSLVMTSSLIHWLENKQSQGFKNKKFHWLENKQSQGKLFAYSWILTKITLSHLYNYILYSFCDNEFCYCNRLMRCFFSARKYLLYERFKQIVFSLWNNLWIFWRYINIHELINITRLYMLMASQSHLFKRLVDHAPFVMIGWSILLTSLQSEKYFSPCSNLQVNFF